ncbi:MAG: hypothetical protein DRR03_05560 [Gammaproteobacteria bacterium]|nr:MAG: hypothetical protein DRR03_05560 [Gammaproteobacteria bacterium]
MGFTVMSIASRLTVTMLVMLLPLSVLAAPTYSPDRVELTLAPGESASFSYNVSAEGAFAIAPYMWYEGHGLPGDWLGSLKAGWQWFTQTASRNITLTVPVDAAGGVYRGQLFGFVSGGAHGFQRGDGVTLMVTVGSSCRGGAECVAGTGNEIELWAPNHSLRSIELLGEIRLSNGCSILSASYSVDDEYGEYSGSGTLEITGDATGYRVSPLLEVSRRGNDRDGRHYIVTLSIETEAGVVTHTRSIIVVHDRRDKAEREAGSGKAAN